MFWLLVVYFVFNLIVKKFRLYREKLVRKLSKVTSYCRRVNYVFLILEARIFRQNRFFSTWIQKFLNSYAWGSYLLTKYVNEIEVHCVRRMQIIKCYTWGKILRETSGTSRFCLPNCGLGSRYPELPSTGHLGEWFSISFSFYIQANVEISPKIPVTTEFFPCISSEFKFILM